MDAQGTKTRLRSVGLHLIIAVVAMIIPILTLGCATPSPSGGATPASATAAVSVVADRNTLGAPGAPLVLVEYGDFQ